MSYVTNVMVSTGWSDSDRFRELNETFDLKYQFRNIAGWDAGKEINAGEFWGGTKFPEVTVWAGAFNYWMMTDTLEALAAQVWTAPQDVQVFIYTEGSNRWTVLHLDSKTREWVGWDE